MHPTLGIQKFHNGIDMAAPGGSAILAAYNGKVVAADYNGSMGNYIMIDHGDSLYTIYMHASALYVSKGAEVSKGDKIAAVGSTGAVYREPSAFQCPVERELCESAELSGIVNSL